MIDTLLTLIAPHPCFGCTKIGSLLCDNCKYDITSEPYEQCLVCRTPTGVKGICQSCQVPYSQAWCVSERANTVEQLIDAYKFERTKPAYKVLADLLHARLPVLPSDTVLVPIPTISSHIRQRGYDHTKLLADALGRRRNLIVMPLLRRQTVSKQRDAGRAQRIRQAKAAFKVRGVIDPDRPYLIIDDVVTTGSTVHWAAQRLRDAGAHNVWVAVIARQPLD